MNVGMRNVAADDFPDGADTKDILHMLSEFFGGHHNGEVVFVVKIVEFIDFFFGNDKGVTLSFGVDVKKGKGLVVLVNFIAGDFAVNDFSEDAGHFWFSL